MGQVPAYNGHGLPPGLKQPLEGRQYVQVVRHREGGRVVRVETNVVYGTAYNLTRPVKTLRLQRGKGRRFQQQSPAMAAGWTDHLYTVKELL